jgi:hypothetical protein
MCARELHTEGHDHPELFKFRGGSIEKPHGRKSLSRAQRQGYYFDETGENG